MQATLVLAKSRNSAPENLFHLGPDRYVDDAPDEGNSAGSNLTEIASRTFKIHRTARMGFIAHRMRRFRF
jgi:hypothetical protein